MVQSGRRSPLANCRKLSASHRYCGEGSSNLDVYSAVSKMMFNEVSNFRT